MQNYKKGEGLSTQTNIRAAFWKRKEEISLSILDEDEPINSSNQCSNSIFQDNPIDRTD